MKNGRNTLFYIGALTAVALVALVAAVMLNGDSGNERSGAIAVATACVTAIALLARRN